MKKILINLVHPNFEKSLVNKRLINAISSFENVTINNLYDKYKEFKIDAKEEQKLLLDNDVIVFQFPMYWFSSPSILKEWFDIVLENNFAYGGQYKLQNKPFAVAVSCGGYEEAFCETGKDKKTVEEFLSPLYGTANYIKMDYKKPFITYGTEFELSEDTLNKFEQDYIKYIKELSK